MTERLGAYTQFPVVPLEWFKPPSEPFRKYTPLLEGFSRPLESAIRIEASARQNRLPILLLRFGSLVYGQNANDLDLNIIFDEDYLSQTTIHEISGKLGLDRYDISAERSDELELMQGKIHILGYALPGISLKFSTTQKVQRLFVSDAYIPRIERRPTGTIDFNKLRKSISITGQVFYPRAPMLTFEERTGIIDFTAPGILYIPHLQTIALPYALNQFIPAMSLYDGTQSEFSLALEENIMTLITDSILSTYHLLDANGNPLEKAYNPKLIYNIFYNRNQFSEEWKQKLVKEYFKQLDEKRTK